MINEQELVPPAPVMTATCPQQIDARGWLMVIIAMVVIGLGSMRPAPAPREPQQIPYTRSAVWMVDALPGVGPKTREQHWQRLMTGRIDSMPESARVVARQVFTWEVPPHTSGDAPQPHR